MNHFNKMPEIKKNNHKENGRLKNIRQNRSEYDNSVLDIARVTRVTKGGKRFSFRATVVIGDKRGKVGVGVAQGRDVSQAIQKAINQAKKKMLVSNLFGDTIPHEVSYKYKSAVVLLKPAEKGHGIKAGGPLRVVVQLAGIKDLTGKIISKTNNKINIARAAVNALGKLKKQK